MCYVCVYGPFMPWFCDKIVVSSLSVEMCVMCVYIDMHGGYGSFMPWFCDKIVVSSLSVEMCVMYLCMYACMYV